MSSARWARRRRKARPVHETSVMARPIHPMGSDSAPKAMNTAVAIACQTKWWTGSSEVHQPAKNTTIDVGSNRSGLMALRVHSSPKTLTAKNRVGTFTAGAPQRSGLEQGLELGLLHLVRTRSGQLVHHPDLLRHLVARQAVLGPRQQLVRIEVGALVQPDDHCRD